MRRFASQFQIFIREDYPVFLLMTGLSIKKYGGGCLSGTERICSINTSRIFTGDTALLVMLTIEILFRKILDIYR